MKKEKEKGKKKKKIIIYIALLLIILYVFYTVFLLTVQSTKLFTVEQGKIYLEETLNGYIIRDETVVKGENYKNGMDSQNETDLKQKISELDEKIQTALKESENLITSDGLSAEVKTIENKIDEKTKEISKLTDMSKIAEYKKEINELVSKKAKIAGDSSKQGSYLKQLIEQRAKYESELNSGAEYIKANRSGIVSYRVDGLEETLTPNNIESLSKEYLNNLNLKTGKIVATNDECGKIIDNFACYIVTISNSNQA